MDKIINPLFTITATSLGGRNGNSQTNDGALKVDLSIPKEMGGPGKPNTVTPEHLFATGYAACFGSALDYVAKQHKKDATKARVECSITIGKMDQGGFALSAKFLIEDKNSPQAELEAFVKETHENVCPYSLATRGNIEVEFKVIGA